MPEVAKKSLRKKKFNREKFLALHEELTFDEYLEALEKNPKLLRSSHQMVLDMILSRGSHTFEKYKKTLTHYNFFDEGEYPIFGLEEPLDSIVGYLKGAAGYHGPDRRFLLLHGPVGSAKSTICTHLKRGLEDYSRTDDGKWFTFKWINLPTEGEEAISQAKEDECPMHEQPLNLVPVEDREDYLTHYNKVLWELTPPEKQTELYDLRCEGELCPRCKAYMNLLLKKYKGDWDQVVDKHIKIVRKVYSEADRLGIGTFQPKDEKNQDSTELNGDVNFQKLAIYGADSSPMSFSFDGEFQISNRGMVEFIEVLKLDVAFLYDLLGVTQEKSIKPKKFPQIRVDEFVLGHSNCPEFKRLKNNEFMQAFRDRTVKIDVPYLTKWDHETNVLKHSYKKVKHHIAPHTFEISAFWCILTRLEEDKHGKLNLAQKAELYNGKMLPSYTEDQVKELMDGADEEEGMGIGVSCRFIQDCISFCLAKNFEYINPFMVLNAVREKLANSPLINNKEHINKYLTCVEMAIKKLENILKNEVQKAMVGDTEAIVRLCSLYIENVMAYIKKGTIRNQFTGNLEKPNERLMRDIERKIDIPDHGAPDFRREVAAFIGDLATQGKKFAWDSNQELKEALELKLFDDIKDTIKLSTMSAEGAMVVEPEQQAKLDALKARMIKWYGYNEKSATDVLDFVGSIWSRGEATEQD